MRKEVTEEFILNDSHFDPNNEETLGFILNKLRVDAGYQQKELAEKLGAQQYRISKMETDQRPPRLETIMHFLDVVGWEIVIRRKNGH